MLWEILSVLVGGMWAVTNILDKYALTKLVKSPSLNELALSVQLIFAVLLIIFVGISSISTFNLILALAAGALEAIAILLYFYAAKLDEISSVLPVWYLDTAFVAVIATFVLGEVLSPSTYIGIALLLVGVFMLGVKVHRKIKPSKSMMIMLLAAFVIAISLILLKYLLGFTDYVSAFVYVTLGYSFVLVPLLIRNYKKVAKLLVKNKKGSIVLITKESIAAAANFLYVLAAVSGPIAVVNALSSLQPLFLLFFAVTISAKYPSLLKEEIDGAHIAVKFVAILLILIATYLIVV